MTNLCQKNAELQAFWKAISSVWKKCASPHWDVKRVSCDEEEFGIMDAKPVDKVGVELDLEATVDHLVWVDSEDSSPLDLIETL